MARNNSAILAAALSLAGILAFAADNADGARFFDERVEPILRARCLGCHNEELKDGISFEDRDSLLKGASYGPAVVPGKPEQSSIIRAVRQKGELKMPPGGRLSGADIAVLTEWVRRGAPWGTKLRPPAKPDANAPSR